MTSLKTSVGRGGKTTANLALLALGLASALFAAQGRTDRRPPEARERRAALAGMGTELRHFGEEEWAAFAKRFEDDPGGATNARLVFVLLSVANVDVNEFELSGSPDALTRALDRFERVVARETAWTARPGSGGAAAYLAISVSRLARECDVGDLADRVRSLQDDVERLVRAEASRRESSSGVGEYAEAAADSAALYATVAVLLPAEEKSRQWETSGRDLARRALAGCPSPEALLFASEGALAYVIAGRGIPPEFGRVPPLSWGSGRRSCRSTTTWSAHESTSDESTSSLLSESRAVALSLLEHFLWTYPPGSGCPGESPGLDL